ncbi:sugar phosphate isomerase/epimerase [Croceicoccus ponticola]|uniref:Sugar phosphate isomerase/epimerase n=1 Tax=Croceicoccus ponticola TaxID=2217664 RepID=A0A437GWP3_9SPHN|nr:TIM barrel protein [Croceicoccus ponticola]RVQ66553.1 sugar phosphate isomerase/epimerase [Croceicoccus ponticola]
MNQIGLASGVLPEFDAATVVRSAHAAGFDSAGLWVDAAEWTPTHTAETRRALADTGISVIDVEVLWLRDEASVDDHRRILDIGMELGAANALCVSSDEDAAKTTDWLGQLCRHVEGNSLRVNLEFGWFSKVVDLASARSIVKAVAHPSAAILIDPIHVDRSQSPIGDIAKLDRSLISYAQFCDARAERPDVHDFDAVLVDAVDLREQMGEGALDLDAMYRALPKDIPLSIELRSEALRNTYPDDPVARAKAVADVTRKWLEARQ